MVCRVHSNIANLTLKIPIFTLTFHFSPGKNPSLFLPESLHILFDLAGFCSDLQQNINWERHDLQRLFDVWSSATMISRLMVVSSNASPEVAVPAALGKPCFSV